MGRDLGANRTASEARATWHLNFRGTRCWVVRPLPPDSVGVMTSRPGRLTMEIMISVRITSSVSVTNKGPQLRHEK